MFDLLFSSLLAQATQAATNAPPAATTAQILTTLGLLAVSTIPTYFLGVFIAKSLRMADYGGKIGFILLMLGLGIMILVVSAIRDENGEPRFGWEPKFGIDLKGGVILVYEINEADTKAAQDNPGTPGGPAPGENVSVTELVSALGERLNPSGVNEIQIRPFGQRQVEIVVPDVGPEEVEAIKRQVANAGKLEFRILANDPERDECINIARNDTLQKRDKEVRNAEGKLVGKWVRVLWDPNKKPGLPDQLSVFNSSALYRNALTGELLPEANRMSQSQFEAFLREKGLEKSLDVLVVVDPDPKKWVTGSELSRASLGRNNVGDPIVEFVMKANGASLMGELTGDNTSDDSRGYRRYLTMVLDNNARSAPSINSMITSNGQITGSFTKKEVEFLVNILQSGRLPAVLTPEPISENQINPLLGMDTIQKGLMSIVISVVAVLVFMVIYYRFAGAVACFALIMNSILVIAFMIMIKAAFTLPGIAGMVLSVGMSVDANVLIYERMREELARGAALRMAIRNGFSKAMSTIIDSNVTTIITAVVLYVIGSEQLKGFAVTLILGILMSMFTAIFVARVIFDVAERKRWITSLNMMDWWGKSNINFIKLYVPMALVSVVLIVIGLVATVARGKNLFDIDFLGGTSIEMMLLEPMPESEVQKRLQAKFGPEKIDFTLTAINNVSDQKNNTIYKIDSSLEDVEDMEAQLEEIFKTASGESLLATNKVDVLKVAESKPFGVIAPAEVNPTNDKKKTPGPAEQPEAETKKSDEKKTAEPKTDDKKTDDKKGADKTDDEKKAVDPADEKKSDEPKAEPKADEPKTEPAEEKKKDGSVRRFDVPQDMLALQDEAEDKKAEEKKKTDDVPAATVPAEEKKTAVAPPTDEAKQEPAPEPKTAPPATTEPAPAASGETATTPMIVAPPVAVSYSEVDLKFTYKVNARTLQMSLTDAIKKLNEQKKLERKIWDLESTAPTWLLLEPVGRTADWTPESSKKFDSWKIRLATSINDTEQIAAEVKEHLENTTVWQSASKIGGKVAGKAREQAVYAVLGSLVGIIAYVWVRFHKLSYGVAAVVALIHDVLVTIGFIAISAYIANVTGFLLIEEFKISLTVVAAILTLIGYSLNDTIVTFDRIREVKGKSPDVTEEMINRSINETLSRTFLTAGTTLIVVVILYILGGAGIHGFAFSMLVGVVAGTYSSVFIAAPLLLWMGNSAKKKSAIVEKKPPQKTKVG